MSGDDDDEDVESGSEVKFDDNELNAEESEDSYEYAEASDSY